MEYMGTEITYKTKRAAGVLMRCANPTRMGYRLNVTTDWRCTLHFNSRPNGTMRMRKSLRFGRTT